MYNLKRVYRTEKLEILQGNMKVTNALNDCKFNIREIN